MLNCLKERQRKGLKFLLSQPKNVGKRTSLLKGTVWPILKEILCSLSLNHSNKYPNTFLLGINANLRKIQSYFAYHEGARGGGALLEEGLSKMLSK